ncbi:MULTISPECIES: MurR/RpiR family transcriptional regulator [unclassified Pseudoclavibacter]|uniref:MurR/RpiR family transcriptional regulator n=1 Tax=unclassified Pseudoclavibacter TaxID=2615177 RepID=UPI00135BF8BE|nr:MULTISPECIES: MurR/RpiR family transcriptional regulator [unclassified Pseudoclavibacter]MBF4459169.1 MurR/RpiR family transcriptional regulator [Pseudoclavibacter sp. VKM Ac-2867]
MSEPAIEELIRDALDRFSASERKVARTLLANYPIAGLERMAELAKRANVSPPTVVRFISRLGFSGYPAFQRRLAREVHEHLGSPLEQYDRADRRVESSQFLGYAANLYNQGINESFAELPESEFYRAVSLLADPRRRVHLMGGRFSWILAKYLCSHLQMIRPGVEVVPDDEIGRLGLVNDSSRTDVIVVFDYRRYDIETVRFAQRLADRGAEVVLLTDRWLSPVADLARVVLPVRVEAPSPFDSLVPALALVESLIAAVTDRIGDEGRARLEQLEAMRARGATRAPLA